MVAPDSWTDPLRQVGQVTAPVQAVFAGLLRFFPSHEGAKISSDDPAAAAASLDALRNLNASLSVRINELEAEVSALAGMRRREVGGWKLGSKGRLIPARVIGPDSAAWRSSRTIAAGALDGVKSGQAAISARLTVDQGESLGVGRGMAVLLGESLVGFVEQTSSHSARIRLLADLDTGMKVRLGRFSDGRFSLLEGYYWLTGRGDGWLEIRDVPMRDVEGGLILAGDVVLTDPLRESLPAAITIGKVHEIVHNAGNPLFANLRIAPGVSELELEKVYVFDPGGG